MKLRMATMLPALLLLASCSQTAPRHTPETGTETSAPSRAAVSSSENPRLELQQALGAKLLPVHRITYSRDSSMLVVVSTTADLVYPPHYENVVVQLWDAASGQLRATLLESLYPGEDDDDDATDATGATGNGTPINDINAVIGTALSPDGSLIGVTLRRMVEQAPAGEDQVVSIRIYRSSDQAVVRDIAMPPEADGFAFVDARTLTITGLSSARDKRWVRSVDITTGRALGTSETAHRNFSTAVQVPAWKSRDWQRLRKWGLSFGAAARAQKLAWEPLDDADTGRIHIALAGDLQRLAIWAEDAVEVWDIGQHRLVARIDDCGRIFDDSRPGPPPSPAPARGAPPCARTTAAWNHDARLSDDGRSLVVLQPNGVFVWNLDSQTPGLALDQCGAARTWPEDAKRWPGAEQHPGVPDQNDPWCGAWDVRVMAMSSQHTLALGGAHSMPYPGEPMPEVGLVDIWNIDSRRRRHLIAGGVPSSLGVSADGRRLAVGAANASVISVWSLPASKPGQLDHVLRTNGAPTGAVAFGGDGRSVVTILGHMTEHAVPHGALELWNLDDGQRLAGTVVPEGRLPVCAVATGERTWSAILGVEPAWDQPAPLEVWEPVSGHRAVFSGKPWNSRTHVSCSRAVSRLAMVTTGNTIEVLDIASRGVVASFDVEGGRAAAVALSTDGRVVAAAVNGEQQSHVRLWALPQKSLKGDIRLAGNHAITSLALSPDTSMIAMGTRAGHIVLCRAEHGASCSQISAHESEITQLLFMPDGDALVSGGRDWRVLMWKIAK